MYSFFTSLTHCYSFFGDIVYVEESWRYGQLASNLFYVRPT